jgi:hypothetical protein
MVVAEKAEQGSAPPSRSRCEAVSRAICRKYRGTKAPAPEWTPASSHEQSPQRGNILESSQAVLLTTAPDVPEEELDVEEVAPEPAAAAVAVLICA